LTLLSQVHDKEEEKQTSENYEQEPGLQMGLWVCKYYNSFAEQWSNWNAAAKTQKAI